MKREEKMERRSFTRVLFQTEALIEYDGKSIRTSIENMSLKGMFLKTTEDIPVNKSLDMKILLSGSSSELSIKLKGKIIRREVNGLAAQFDGMDLDSFIHLKNVIAYNAEDQDKIMDEFLVHMAMHLYDIT
jgi:hypothetical protein